METVEAMIAARGELDNARVHTPREWAHKQKMERKALDRDERSARRTAQYERTKLTRAARLRKWLGQRLGSIGIS